MRPLVVKRLAIGSRAAWLGAAGIAGAAPRPADTGPGRPLAGKRHASFHLPARFHHSHIDIPVGCHFFVERLGKCGCPTRADLVLHPNHHRDAHPQKRRGQAGQRSPNLLLAAAALAGTRNTSRTRCVRGNRLRNLFCWISAAYPCRRSGAGSRCHFRPGNRGPGNGERGRAGPPPRGLQHLVDPVQCRPACQQSRVLAVGWGKRALRIR